MFLEINSSAIGSIDIQDGDSLTEQILAEKQLEKPLKQITFLENKMSTTKQPRCKPEPYQKQPILGNFVDFRKNITKINKIFWYFTQNDLPLHQNSNT